MNHEGRGPAWNNSLFEDNAEFGLGMRLGLDAQDTQARVLLESLAQQVGDDLAADILDAPQETEAADPSHSVNGCAPVEANELDRASTSPTAALLLAVADTLVRNGRLDHRR